MTLILANDLHKSYGSHNVLKGISFAVEEGEIFGILGPSGSGKTTLIEILIGHNLADNGVSELFGVSSTQLREIELNSIGAVMDKSGLFDRLTCWQNLDIFRRIYDIPITSVEEGLKLVGLFDSKDKKVIELSKGMKQRLVIARALIHKPRLLVLDEPTSGLDPNTAAEIHSLILKLKSLGVTVLIVTHNMKEAHKLCNNVAFLFDGKFIECGSPDTICERYNINKKFILRFEDGTRETYIDNQENRVLISTMLLKENLVSIQSTQVDLGDVFLELTGKELV